jgi:hypothetical protein
MLPEQWTELAHSAERGDALLSEEFFATLYNELQHLARRELRRNVRVTLSPTTLLHETYLSLSSRQPGEYPDRARFLSYASCAVRGPLVDHLRRCHAQKRGGAFEITSLPTEVPEAGARDEIDIEGMGKPLETRPIGTEARTNHRSQILPRLFLLRKSRAFSVSRSARFSASGTRRASFCSAISVKASTSETSSRRARARRHGKVG